MLGDALFAFDKATLDPRAEETLAVLGPQLAAAGPHPAKVVGHTDSIGSDSYNQRLSERRAAAVRDWLVAHQYLAAGTPASGRGRLDPVAPNRKPDGSDDPAGRQKNRRVEVLVDGCG
ncbi:MAG: OmpA family protein [Dongiaceae bacterium]